MTPEELQANYIAAVLYFCGVTNSDANRYTVNFPGDLDPAIGTLGLDGNDNYIIASWAITAYATPNGPDNTTLASPNLSDVLTFYNNAYFNPYLLSLQPFPQLSNSSITAMETTLLLPTQLVTNTTNSKIQYWSGSTWTNLY
jgi:hypothetical protein